MQIDNTPKSHCLLPLASHKIDLLDFSILILNDQRIFVTFVLLYNVTNSCRNLFEVLL